MDDWDEAEFAAQLEIEAAMEMDIYRPLFYYFTEVVHMEHGSHDHRVRLHKCAAHPPRHTHPTGAWPSKCPHALPQARCLSTGA